MYDLILLAFGTIVGLAGLYLLVPVFGPRCDGPLAIVVVGVLCLGAVDPFFRAFSIYSGHFFESIGALFVLIGLFDSVRRNLTAANWTALFDTDHRSIRPREGWMEPMDDRILELLEESQMVLTPSLLAYNIEYSREAVNRRLLELCDRGYVERVDRGKYRIAPAGRRYLRCDDDRRDETDPTSAPGVGSRERPTALDD